MKTFAAISALLLAAVSAAPTEKRQTATEYDITGFTAKATPEGPGASISFDVTIPNVLTTTCTYSDQTSVSTLPDLAFTACANANVQWEFHHIPSQPGTSSPYLIVITYKDASTGVTVGGWNEWPASDFPITQDGSTSSQSYTGAPGFVISNLS